MPYDIFISYAREDGAVAETIERHVEQAGLRCYRDTHLAPGLPEWRREIAEKLAECPVLLVILSENSVRSKYVIREVELADELSEKGGRAFIPLFLRENLSLPAELKLLLPSHQRIYWSPSTEANLARVETAVRSAVDRHCHAVAYAAIEQVQAGATASRRLLFDQELWGLKAGDTGHRRLSAQGADLVITSQPQAYTNELLTGLPRFAEFVFETTLAKLSGSDDSWFGLQFGAGWPGDFHEFILNGHGAARISKRWQGAWHDLAIQQATHGFAHGSKVNHLRVVRRKGRFHLFVNGLHALTSTDADIRIGHVGFVLGPELTVRFSSVELAGVELDSLCQTAWDHWSRLEVAEARQLAQRILELDPGYGPADNPQLMQAFLTEMRPDRRLTFLVVVGASTLPQIHDGMPAMRLKTELDARGDSDLKCALVVTDVGLQRDPIFRQCPLICVGGPPSNALTAELKDSLPLDPCSTDRVRIQHDLSNGGRQILLWGTDAPATVNAVEQFITNGLMERFVRNCWS
jgi:TIR domain